MKIKHNSKEYGFLRCSMESVPKLKILATQLGYPSMVAFLDKLAEMKVGEFKRLKLDK